MADEVAISVRLNYTSNLVAGLQADEAALKSFGAQAEAVGAKAAAQAESVTSSTNRMGQVTSSSLSKIDPDVKRAVSGISTLGLAIGGVAVAADYFAVKSAVNLQHSLSLLQTQAGASRSEVQSISKAVMEMGTSLGTGPQQLVDAMFHIESAGLRGAQALDVLHAAAIGAKVGNADLQATTQALIGATVSGIKGVQDETQAVAELSAIVGSGDVRLQDLVSALSTGVLPAARVVGLAFKDVGAALATLTDNTVPADEAATRLRMTFSLMAAPTQAAQKALASIGLSSTQLATDMRQNNGLLVALEDLKKHLEQSGKSAVEQEAVIARAFGGGRSSSAIETLLTELDRLKSKYEEQAKLVGQFGEAWKKTQETAAFQFGQLQAAVETLGITLGAALLPSLQGIAKDLIPVTQGIQSIAAASPGAVTAVSALGVAMLALSLGMKGAMALAEPWVAILNITKKAHGDVATSGKAAATGIASVGEAAAVASNPLQEFAAFLGMTNVEMAATAREMPSLAAGLGATGAATEGAAASTGILSGAIDTLLGPVGLILLGTTLASIAFEKSPAFRGEVSKAGDALQTGLAKGVLVATDSLGLYKTKLQDASSWLDTMGAAADSARNHNQTFGGFLQQQLPLLGTWASALGKVADAYGKIGNAIDNLPQGATEKFGGPKQPAPTYDKNDLKADVSVSAQVKYFNSQGEQSFDAATKQAAADLKAYALAVEAGSTAQKQLFTQAVGSAQYAKDLGDKLQAGTAKVDLAAGDFAGALQATTKVLDDKYQQAIAQVALALFHHADNVQQLVRQGVQSAKDDAAIGKDKTLAAQMIAKAAGIEVDAHGKLVSSIKTTADAFSDLTSKLQKQSTAATGDVALNLLGKHNGNLEQLVNIGAQKAEKLQNANAKEDTARLLIAKKMGDWAQVIDLERQHLQKVLSDATAKYAEDRSTGAPQAVLSADKSKVTEANSALDRFNKNVAAAGVKLLTAAEQFANEQSKAQKEYDAALNTVAADFLKTGTTTRAHAASLAAAKITVDGFTTALSKAAATLQTEAERFVSDRDKAQKKYDDALNTVAEDFVKTGHATQAHEAALASAKTGVDAFTTAMDKATALLATPSVKLKSQEDQAQTRYDNALAQVTLDIKAHGVATRQHEQALQSARIALDAFTAAAAKAAHDALPDTFKNRESTAQTKADTDQQALVRAIYNGTGNLTDLTDAAALSAAAVEKYTLAHQKAQQLIADALAQIDPALLTFSENLSRVNTAFNTALDNLATIILNGTGSQSALPGNHQPGRGPIDPDTGGSLVLTNMDKAINDLVTAYVNQKRVLDAQTEAQRIAAVQTGQWSDVLKIDSQKITTDLSNAYDGLIEHFLNGTGSVDDLVASYKQAYAAQQVLTAATRQAALTVGDFATVLSMDQKALSTSFDDLAGAFLTGKGNVSDLIASYLAAKKAVDDDTAAQIKADLAVGNFADALNKIKGVDQSGYDDALANIALKLHDHQQITQADIDAIQQHRQALDQWTQDTWDATFAGASLAQQSKMLADRFSGLISQANTLHSGEQSVFQAQLTVLSDQAAQQTRALSDLVSLIGDQTAIISADAGMTKAGMEGQIAVLKDQGAIAQAQFDLAKATTAQDKQLALDQLKAAQDQVTIDKIAAGWSQTLARDSVKIAQDKTTVDRANQAAQAAVDAAKMQTDQDSIQLAEDQLTLTEDTLGYLSIIASAFADVNQYGEQVQKDLDAINADQNKIGTDQLAAMQAQANAAQVAAEGQLQLAQDQQQQAMDQAAADASSLQGQARLAQDTYRVTIDQLAVQQATLQVNQAQLQNNTNGYLAMTTMLKEFALAVLSGSGSSHRNINAVAAQAARSLTVDPALSFHSSTSMP